jgi:protein-S-isoprenylcysteine O-methyltransferase Ste14
MTVLNKTSWHIILLIGLAIVFAVGLSFATLEIPQLLAGALRGVIPDPGYDPTAIEKFIQEHHLRAVGYACLGIIFSLIIAGFVTRKRSLSSAGAVLMFLPTFGYFASSMFFLAGLGILRVPWMPIWDASFDLLKLGDIAYLPYMIVVYPLSLVCGSPTWGSDFREIIGVFVVGIGLFIFLLGTITWLYGKYQKKDIVDFWIYRYSRHPQYLGFIIWSYGIMVLGALFPVVRGGVNPGASLPWLVSSLVIVGIALNEEMAMAKRYGQIYLEYQQRTSFMLPVGRFIASAISAPARILFHTKLPQKSVQIAIVLVIYFVFLVLVSLPFVLLHWPPLPGWSSWPFQ